MRQKHTSNDDMTLNEWLAQYGYLLRQKNGYLWLAGTLSGRELQFAREVIERRFGTAAPAPTLAPRRPAPRRAAARAA